MSRPKTIKPVDLPKIGSKSPKSNLKMTEEANTSPSKRYAKLRFLMKNQKPKGSC